MKKIILSLALVGLVATPALGLAQTTTASSSATTTPRTQWLKGWFQERKEIIKEKAPKDSELSEIAPDRLSLQIEGGDVLKKGSATLEEVGLRENNVILVSISDKSGSAS